MGGYGRSVRQSRYSMPRCHCLYAYILFNYYAPPLIGGALSDDAV